MPDADRFGPRIWLIWGGALIVALWLAMTAITGIAQVTAPRLALSVYPQSGFAYQTQASDSVGEVPIQEMHVSDAALASALAALRREPFATSALTFVGMSHDLQGDHDRAAKIVAAAHGLDKRQMVANAWLIHYYGLAGQDRDVLALLDEALKVRPELTQRYMPAFAQALQNPETVPVFQTLLRGRPGWENSFWQAVASDPAALPNAEVLRSHMLAGGTRLGATDTLLMDAFVRGGRVDLALSFGKNLPTIPDDQDSMVRNSSFSQMPVLPPLDWEFISDGRIGAALNESADTLEINALPGSGGTVARQLLALAPGDYSLLVKLGQAELARGSDITMRLQCAEKNAVGGALSQQLKGDLYQAFTIPDTGCRFYWLNVDFSALDSSEPAMTSIAEIRIVRGQGRPQQ